MKGASPQGDLVFTNICTHCIIYLASLLVVDLQEDIDVNYFLTAEQELIQQIARRFARERVAPLAAALDEKGEFPRKLLGVLALATTTNKNETQRTKGVPLC
jgi:hypothetical protein